MDNDQDYYKSVKRNNKISLILLLVIVLGYTIYTIFGGGGGAGSMSFQDTEMTITVADDETPFALTIPYEEIQAVETVPASEALDLGEMVRGAQTKRLWYGVWKNDRFGEYSLYALPNLKTYCVITLTDGAAVLNVEDKTATESFSEALVKLLVDKGYWTSASGK